MQEITTERGRFNVWESPKELPITRFRDFNKYIVQAIGIGSTLADVDNHYKALDAFLAAEKITEARRERYNLHYNLFLMLNRIQITDFCFIQFIQSIDGEPITDYSESNLAKISDRLGSLGLSRGKMEEVLNDIKKKLILS